MHMSADPFYIVFKKKDFSIYFKQFISLSPLDNSNIKVIFQIGLFLLNNNGVTNFYAQDSHCVFVIPTENH